jgi:prevent-host-death family protein
MIFKEVLIRLSLGVAMAMSILAGNIFPLAQFKARASEVLNGMKADNKPVVITQNGVAAAVLLPPEEYDRLVERSEFMRAVETGLADSGAGRLRSQAELAAELRERYKG